MTGLRYRVVVVAAVLASACSADKGAQGSPGENAKPCTVKDNGDGTKTIACPGNASITLADGKAGTDGTNGTKGANGTNGTNGAKGANGTSCTVVDNGNSTSTVKCGTTVATLNDGANGTPANCTAVANANATSTITCSDGSNVTIHDGATGSTGAAGSSCSVATNADGSKLISCTDGTWATVNAPIATSLALTDNMPGVVVKILGVTGGTNSDQSFKAGDKPVVHFTVQTTAGATLGLSQLDGLQAWMSGPSNNYQHIIPTDTSKRTLVDLAANAVANQDGSYTYTFTTALPTNYPGPMHDTDKFTTGELTGPLVAGTYRIAVAAYKNYLIAGASTRDPGTATIDVQVGSATTVTTHPELVTTANCNQCHQTLQMHGGTYRDVNLCVTCHTAGAEDGASIGTNGATCGNSGDPACPAGSTCVANKCTDNTNVTVEFRVMIHKLHNSIHLPSVNGVSVDASGNRIYDNTKAIPYQIAGGSGVAADFSTIQFPVIPSYQTAMPRRNGYSALVSTVAAGATLSQRTMDDNIRKGIVSCDMCHGTGANNAVTAPKDAALIATNLSRRACGSCHDDIDWTKPYKAAKNGTMPAQANDTNCGICHATPGADGVPESHHHVAVDQAVTPSPVLAITALGGGTGANGTFKAGDPLKITWSVKDGAGADLAPYMLDAMSWVSTGPTTNRQAFFPYASTTGVQFAPFDFAGRTVVGAASTGNGSLFKVFGAGATQQSETLTLLFTTSTAFNVVGTASGASALGTGTLGAATSTFPSGASLANFYIAPAAPAGAFKVQFADARNFTVSVAGTSVGTGTLPAASAAGSTSTRFVSTDKSLAFNVSIGATAASASTVWNGVLVKTPAPNQVAFVVVAGSAAFAANDRIYYDYVAPAATYTRNFPMDIPVEVMGIGDTTTTTFTAANGPVWFGRQSVWQRTAAPTGTAVLVTPTKFMDRQVAVDDVTKIAGLAANNYVVLEVGTAREEYALVRGIDATKNRVFLSTPLRWVHPSGAVQKAALVAQLEGVDYTLLTTGAANTITFTAAPAAGAAVVMTYRTNGTFGWKRSVADTLQAVFYQPPNGSQIFDETTGNWAGKSLIAGTYTVAMFATRKSDVIEPNSNGELQTYTGTSHLAQQDYLYGGATTLQPYSLISDPNACNRCHADLAWHGAGRRGAETCLMCHGEGGLGGNWATTNLPTDPQYITYNFRTFLHSAHKDTFPAMPGGSKNCAVCHGTATAWNTPTDRNHPTQQVTPVKPYTMACQGCHNTAPEMGHILSQTAASTGQEACATCHAAGKPEDVTLVHKAR